MKRSVVYYGLVFLSVLALNACGGGGGGGGGLAPVSGEATSAPVADAGGDRTVVCGALVTLDGSASSASSGTLSYSWSVVSGAVTLTDPDTVSPSFTAPAAAGDLTFELTVTDDSGKEDSDTCSVYVRETVLGFQGDAEAVLNAAYAGIGYMDKESTTDNERFYDLMLGDLNDMVVGVTMDVLLSMNESQILNFVLMEQEIAINYTHVVGGHELYTVVLTVTPGQKVNGYNTFSANLDLTFTDNGYPLGDCAYFGDDAVVDLKAEVTGLFKATIISLIPPNGTLEDFFIRSVQIEACEGLAAVYTNPDLTVAYQGWNLAYEVYYGSADPVDTEHLPQNLEIVPFIYGEMPQYADHRDYTLGGVFSVDGEAYAFAAGAGTSDAGFSYRQRSYRYKEGDVFVDRTLLMLEGALSVPDLDGLVSVTSPDDITDGYLTSGTIFRNAAGYWEGGHVSLQGLESENVRVDFGLDAPDTERADFSGDLGDWSVDDWQDEGILGL